MFLSISTMWMAGRRAGRHMGSQAELQTKVHVLLRLLPWPPQDLRQRPSPACQGSILTHSPGCAQRNSCGLEPRTLQITNPEGLSQQSHTGP